MNVLEPEEFSDSLFPSANGLKVDDAANIINKLKTNFDVVGMAITECTAITLKDLQPIETILQQTRL